MPFLLDSWSGAVVLRTPADLPWEHLRLNILTELGRGQCRLGIGNTSARPSAFPRSLREAQLA